MTNIKPYTRIIAKEELTQDLVDQMFSLMDKYYVNMIRAAFEKDLSEKTSVICLFDESHHQLVGFSTLHEYIHEFENQQFVILYSGDTILDKDYWGRQELAKAFGECMIRLMKKYPDHEIYWFLISKGFRTYKYLPAFYINYYPNPKAPTPEKYQRLMDSLASSRFPEQYDVDRKIIRAKQNSEYLKEGFHPSRNLKNELENFYYDKNPGYQQGDELVCLTQLKTDNICDFIKRVLKLDV